MDRWRNREHKALDYAGKGIPVDEWNPLFGTDLLDVLARKEYVYVTDEYRPRVMLALYGARALLDYEGLDWQGECRGCKARR